MTKPLKHSMSNGSWRVIPLPVPSGSPTASLDGSSGPATGLIAELLGDAVASEVLRSDSSATSAIDRVIHVRG